MNHLTVAGLCALLLIQGGCTAAARAVGDAGAEPRDSATHEPDAAPPGTASFDLHFLVVAALLEMERSLIARCPCLTLQGEYDSASQCRSAVALGSHWIECANRIDLSAFDSTETRESLRCSVAELSQRSECLMGSACTADAIAGCMTQSFGCMLPLELFSQVASTCEISLSR
jgi:hypothetical protein